MGQAAHVHEALESGDAPVSSEHDHRSGDPVTADSHDHHGCAGHVLGHLFVAPAERTEFAIPDTQPAAAIGRQSDFVTNPSRRLDRPPLDSDLA